MITVKELIDYLKNFKEDAYVFSITEVDLRPTGGVKYEHCLPLARVGQDGGTEIWIGPDPIIYGITKLNADRYTDLGSKPNKPLN